MGETVSFAEVIVDLSSRNTDRVFHYAIPPDYRDKIAVGSMVTVPFGNRHLTGYVVGFGIPPGEVRIKEIAGVIDEGPVFTPELLELARWMAENYLCSTAEAFARILSPRLQVKASRRADVLVYPALAGAEMEKALSLLGRSPKQLAVLQKAAGCPGLTKSELAAAAMTSSKTVDALLKKGLLKVSAVMPAYLQDAPGDMIKTGSLTLNQDQEAALREISASLDRGRFDVFLLHGITGSGKTEVYLRAIAAALETGRQAVALVPEISLTPQMVELFRGRFGGQVAVLHSALSGGERYQEWRRVKEGQASVVLGTRSAVFAPCPRPGLFIIDEEHEPSYKQDDHMRYHAREIALKRAQLAGAVVVLGSATPSLESFSRAVSGGPYKLLKLPRRVDERPLPRVRVIDLRQEIREGNRGIFSRPLLYALNGCLERGGQAILFLNRRGYSTVVVCRECGLVLKCPRCDISLTYHLEGRLRCHYCNHLAVLPGLCPGCGSRYIRHFGAGTQKVEEEARKIFPKARIVRMDSDSTAQKGSHQKILDAFRDGLYDILIGTQMIAKGLDLPGVTLVGVINADTALHMPDFRAAERTFQLLTQVAGRAGRGGLPGEVLIQTYSPEHYSISAAAAHDYEGFYRSEMAVRRVLGYPPFSHLARLLFTHEDEEEVRKGAEKSKELLDRLVSGRNCRVEILGPAPAPLSKIKGHFRWQLVLKGRRRENIKEIIREGLAELERDRRFKVAVNVDINPQGMF
ncbi:primosomal protein N' (replication factor Y) - superfamily II helicase [Pelotomaculum thermopropionicum SI]|uniref:Replication restart protein PriA n=1 Tax=Pelotomaculum thermopropionicum (strain DSM 13744 / JCM 10971 / SI) TaxID=370438 RepID=A5D1C1_PELTS|nr:primosomal protein N' (replication factor Y) - superfamily II helicase [Pelotomaculum thermopropionicum SI]